MVPTRADIFDLHSICEHLNRFLSMHVNGIADSQLPVLVVANGPDSTCLCQKEGVEFTTGDFLNPFTIEVRLGILDWFAVCVLNLDSTGVPVKDFSVLRVLILEFAKLEPVVLPHTENFALFADIAPMLEPQRKVSDVYVSQWLDQSGLISMDVVKSAQLSCIVIAPSKHVTVVVLSHEVATPHFDVLNPVLELCFQDWSLLSWFEKGGKFLDASD